MSTIFQVLLCAAVPSLFSWPPLHLRPDLCFSLLVDQPRILLKVSSSHAHVFTKECCRNQQEMEEE
jgi:hypothetical protein